MTREEAEVQREQMAQAHPEATWLVAENEPGTWSVVKVGMKPVDPPSGESIEERPKPPTADDPRSAQSQNFSQWGVG